MAAKLVAVGDSLTQGFQHGAIRRTDWSYPAMIARVLRGEPFRQADFSGAGTGGPLVDLELVLTDLASAFGSELSWWEAPSALLAVRSLMDRIEDYWERGAGTAPSPTGPVHHNLAVWGFEVLDALTLSDAVCLRNTRAPSDNLIAQVPEFGMYRTARRVLNPAQRPELEELLAFDLADRIAVSEGGIENLIVSLGSNNVLGTCVDLRLDWSHSADFLRLAHARNCTIWEPGHFAQIYRQLVGRVAAVNAERVFLTTVPHVTVAPVTRGVSPRAKSRGTDELVDGYYEYYTRFWIWDDHFQPDRDECFTREDAKLIDHVIDEYNACIRAAAAANGWHLIDLCGLLDQLAFRRSRGKPSYRFPAPLVEALARRASTAFRVRPDGVVLLDTRYLRLPAQAPAPSAASAQWQSAYRGGLFGVDGVHPTTIGYGLIAHEALRVMKDAGVPGADAAQLPWDAIVSADTLVSAPPIILSSLQTTLELLFGKHRLDRVIRKLAGYGAEA